MFKLTIYFATLLLLSAECELQNPKYIPNFYLGPLSSLLRPEVQNQPLRQCDCGRANNIFRPNDASTRIINGTSVNYHQYPWLVIITYKGKFICGGSIISDYYILTAAHCMKDGFLKDDLKVVLGEYNRCQSSSDTAVMSIADIIRHSEFNPKTFSSDIMLLRLNMKLTFNSFVRPICLPEYDYYQRFVVSKYRTRVGTIAGWGTTIPNDEDSISCTPRQLKMPILDRKDCLGNADSLFCAGYLDGRADSCQGDSGGPLQVKNRHNLYEIIGVISSGQGCAVAGNPGLYTDVLQNLNWIYKRITDSRCLSNSNPFFN